MIELTTLTGDSRQTVNIEGENREEITLNLEYFPRSQSWNFSISYDDFEVNNIRLTNSVNCLNQFKNIIPFGIYCTTTDGLDPYFINDFLTGRVTLFLLSDEDLETIEEGVYTIDSD